MSAATRWPRPHMIRLGRGNTGRSNSCGCKTSTPGLI
jgi:hypothetical protein